MADSYRKWSTEDDQPFVKYSIEADVFYLDFSCQNGHCGNFLYDLAHMD